MSTYGEKAVGLSFNPSADPLVDTLKQALAEIIDRCASERAAAVDPGSKSSERARLWSIAITEAQTAQMWAVKAATWKD